MRWRKRSGRTGRRAMVLLRQGPVMVVPRERCQSRRREASSGVRAGLPGIRSATQAWRGEICPRWSLHADARRRMTLDAPITRLDAPRVQVFLGQAASMMARGRTTPFRRARRMACSDGGQARLRPGVSGRGPAAEPMKPVPGSGRRADRLQLAPSLFTDRPLGPFRPASGPAFRDSRHRSLLSRPSVGIGRRPSRPCLTAPRVVTFDPASASRRPTD